MARKFEYRPEHYAWHLEKCEEELFILAYEEICRFIPADQKWKTLFEINFFDQGWGLSFEDLESINSVRRRRGLLDVVVRETGVYEYGRTPDKQMKSNQRRQVREDLKDLSDEMRQYRFEFALAEEAMLPAPYQTYEEYRARQSQQREAGSLTMEEVTKRVLAQQNIRLGRPVAGLLSPARAARMLAIVSPTLWSEIIPKLSADDALQVAESVNEPELRDALVKHSLEAA